MSPLKPLALDSEESVPSLSSSDCNGKESSGHSILGTRGRELLEESILGCDASISGLLVMGSSFGSDGYVLSTAIVVGKSLCSLRQLVLRSNLSHFLHLEA